MAASQPRSCARGSPGIVGKLPQVFGNQLVLRVEVAIERHLVGAGGLGDRLHADRPDAEPVKQVRRGVEDALARRNLRICR
jgi:hypothetical protein